LKLDSETVRGLISGSLLSFMIVTAAILWLVNLLAQQRVFGALLSAELMAFSMLVYVSGKRSYRQLSRPVLLIGCAILGLFLLLAILV
jgi:hypothetical protein